MLITALAVLLALPQGLPPEELAAVPLTQVEASTFGAWREHLLPRGPEIDRIPWIPNFIEGLERAGEADRPLFFWAMNGHPLGCT